MTRPITLAAALMLAAPAMLSAQQHDQHSAHVGKETREVKALSAEETAALLAGEGMGLALAAELNRYPGPRHVLDHAADLGLTETQMTQVRRIFEEMQAGAIRLGTEIVAAEKQLDEAFAGRTIDEAALRQHTSRIGELQAALRFAHLRAHLQTTALLTEMQIRHYDMVRGYTAGSHDH